MWDLVKRNLLRERSQLGRSGRASVQLKHNEIVEAFLKAGRQKVPRSGSGRLNSVDSVTAEGGRTRAVRGGIWRAVSKVGLAIAMAIRLLNPYVLISVAFGQHRSLLAHFSARVDSMRAVLSPRIGRRRRLTAWIQDTLPHRHISEAAMSVWLDGSLLCGIVEVAVPGSCPGYDSLSHPNTDRSATLWLGQKLAARYLGVPPAFADEDLVLPYLTVSMERRMLRYLATIKAACARVDVERQRRLRAIQSTDRGCNVEDDYSVDSIIQSSLQPGESLLECVARGMGLVLGIKGRKSSFYLYLNPNHPHRHIHRLMQLSHLNDSESSFEDEAGAILMQIRGPDGDFGAALISTAPGSCSSTWGTSLTILNESWYGRIPIVYNTTAENVTVSYVPQTSGRHELILLLRGGSHVPGSPFSVAVEESSEVSDDDGKRTRFGCEPIDEAPSPLSSGMKKTKSHESGLEKTHRRTGSGNSDPGVDSKGEVVLSRKRKRVISRVVNFVNEKMLLTEDGKFEKLPKKRRECLTTASKEEKPPENQENISPPMTRNRYYSTLSSSRRMRHLDVNEPIHGTYPGRRSPIESGRVETTYGLSKSGFEGEMNMEVEDCEEAKRVKEEERKKRERLVRVSDVASHHKTESLSSTNFRDHCRRILWLCDILLEHSPRQESLEILNTAGDILEGKRVHPTIMEESEPEDSSVQGPSATRSSAKGNLSSLNEQISPLSLSSNASAIAQRLQRTPSETGGLNEVSKWKDGRRQFHSWTRADKSGGSSGGRLIHKGGSYRGIVVRDMTAEPLTGAYAGGDDLVEEDDEAELEGRIGRKRGEEMFIFDGGRLVPDKPNHSLPKRKTSKFTKLSENRGYSAETLEQITSSDPDKGCGRTTIRGKGLNKSIAPKTKEPINYRDEKAERVNKGREESKLEGGKKLDPSENGKESKSQAGCLLGEKDGKSKDSEVKNISATVATAALKVETCEKELSDEKILSNFGTRTVPWNDSATMGGEKVLQGESSKGEPPPTEERGGEAFVVKNRVEVDGEVKKEVEEGLSGEVRCRDVETAKGASVETKAPGSATREINGRLPPPPHEIPTPPLPTIHSSEKYTEIQECKGTSGVSRSSTSLVSEFRRMILEEERKEEEGARTKERDAKSLTEEKLKKAPEEHEDNGTSSFDKKKQRSAVKVGRGGKEIQNESEKATVFEIEKVIELEEKDGKGEDTNVEGMGKEIDRVNEDTEKVIEQHEVIAIDRKDMDVKEATGSDVIHDENKIELVGEVAKGKGETNKGSNEMDDGSKAHEGETNDTLIVLEAKQGKTEAAGDSELVHEKGRIESIKGEIDGGMGGEGRTHHEISLEVNAKDEEGSAEIEILEREGGGVEMEMGYVEKEELETLEQQEIGEGIRNEKNDEPSEKIGERDGIVREEEYTRVEDNVMEEEESAKVDDDLKEGENVEEEENAKVEDDLKEVENVEEEENAKKEDNMKEVENVEEEENAKVEDDLKEVENVEEEENAKVEDNMKEGESVRGEENSKVEDSKEGKEYVKGDVNAGVVEEEESPTIMIDENEENIANADGDAKIGNKTKENGVKVATTRENEQKSEESKPVQNEEHARELTESIFPVYDAKEEEPGAMEEVQIRSEIVTDSDVKKALNEEEVTGENYADGMQKIEEESSLVEKEPKKRTDKPWISSANEDENPNECAKETKREINSELEATNDEKIEKRKSITYTELIGRLLCTDSFPPDSLEWFEDRLNELEEEELQGTMESMEIVDKTTITGCCAVGDEVWEEPVTEENFGLGFVALNDLEAREKGKVMEEEEDIWPPTGSSRFNRGEEEEREEFHRTGNEGIRRGGIGVGVVVAGGMMSREETKNEEGRGGRMEASRRRRMWGASRSKSIEEGLPLPNDDSVGREWERISIGIDAMEDSCIRGVIAGVSGERRWKDRRSRDNNIEVIEEGENQERENEEEVSDGNNRDLDSLDIIEEIDEKGCPISESYTGTEASEGKGKITAASGEELKAGEAEESKTKETTNVGVCEKNTEVRQEEKNDKEESSKENSTQEKSKKRGMFDESWWASTKSSGEGDVGVEEIRMNFISTIKEESWGPASLGVEAKEEDITIEENKKYLEEMKIRNNEEQEEKQLKGDEQDGIVSEKMASDDQSAQRTYDEKEVGQLLSQEIKEDTPRPKPNDLNESDREDLWSREDDHLAEVLKEENIDEAEEAKELEEESCEWGQDPLATENIAEIAGEEKQDRVKVKERHEEVGETKCAEHKDSEAMSGSTKQRARSTHGIGDWDWYMDDEQEEEETPSPSAIPKEPENKQEINVQYIRLEGEHSANVKRLEHENSGEWEFVDTGKHCPENTAEGDGGTEDREEFESNYIYTKGTKELHLGTPLHETGIPQSSGAFEMGMERVSDLLGSIADIPTDSDQQTMEGMSPKREGEDLFRVRIALDEWEGIKRSDNIGPETEVIVGEFDLLGDWGDAGGAIGLVGEAKVEDIIGRRKVESEESISLDSLEERNEPRGFVEGSSNLSEYTTGQEEQNISEENKWSGESNIPEILGTESNKVDGGAAESDTEDIEVITTPGWEESTASERTFTKREYRTPFRDLEDMLGTSFTFKTISCRAQFNLWPSDEAFGGQRGQGTWMEHIDMDAFMNAAQSSQQTGVVEGSFANMTTFTKICTTGNSKSSSTTTEQYCFSSADKKGEHGEGEELDAVGEDEEEIVLEEQDFDDRSDELIPTIAIPPVHSPTYQSFRMESHPRRHSGDAFLIFESPGITMFSPLEGEQMSSDNDDERIEGLERFGEIVQGHDEEIEGVELGGEWEEGVIYLDDDEEEDGRVVGRRGSGEYEKFGDEVVGRVEKEIWDMIHQESVATSSNEMAFAVVMEPEDTEIKQKMPVHPTGRWCPRLSMLSPAMSAISEEEGEEALSYKEDEGRITRLESGESDDKSNHSFENERSKADRDTVAEFQDVVKEELPDEHLRDYLRDKTDQKTQAGFTPKERNKSDDKFNEDSDQSRTSADVEEGLEESFSRRRSSTSSGVSDVGAEAPADCGAAFVVSSELAVTLALGISITQIIPSAIDLPEISPIPKVDEATEAISTLDVISRDPQQPKSEHTDAMKSNNTEKDSSMRRAENCTSRDEGKFNEHLKNDKSGGKSTNLASNRAATEEIISRERNNAQLTSSVEERKSTVKSDDFDPKEVPLGSEYGSNTTSSEENSLNILGTPTKNTETQTEPVIVMTDIKELVENGIVVKEDMLLSICEPAAIRKQGNKESNPEYKPNTHQGDYMLQQSMGKDGRVDGTSPNLEGGTSGTESIKNFEKTLAVEPKNIGKNLKGDEWDANEVKDLEEKRIASPSRKDHIDPVLNNTTDEREIGLVGTMKGMGDGETPKNRNHHDLNASHKELIETVEKDRRGETEGTKNKNHHKGMKRGKAVLKGWEEDWYAEEDEDDSSSPVSLATSASVVEDTKGGGVKGRSNSYSEKRIKETEKADGNTQGGTTAGENNFDSQSSELYSPPGGTKKKEFPKQKSKESPPRKIPLEKLLGWPSESFSLNGNGAGCSGVASRRESVFDDYQFNMSGFDAKGNSVSRRVKTQDSTGLEYYLDVDQLLNVPLEATEPEVKYVSAKEIMDSFSRGIGIDSPEKTGENQSLDGRDVGVERPDCSGSDGETSGGVPVDSLGGENPTGGSKVNLGDKVEDLGVRDSFGPWDGDYFADEASRDDILSLGSDQNFPPWSPQSEKGTPEELFFEDTFLSDDMKMRGAMKDETPQSNDPNQEGASGNIVDVAKEHEPMRDLLIDLGQNDIVELRESENKSNWELRKRPEREESDEIEFGTEKQGGVGSSGRNVRNIINIFENSEGPAQKKDSLPGKRKKGVESLIALFGEKTANEKTADGRGEHAEVAPTEFPETKTGVRKTEDTAAREETNLSAAQIKEAESVHDEEKVLPPPLDSEDLINVGKISVGETLLLKEKEGYGTDEMRENIIALEELGADSSSEERSMQPSGEVATSNTPTLKRTVDIFKSLPEEHVVGWEAIKVASEVEKIILESGNNIERNKEMMGGVIIGPELEEIVHEPKSGEGSGTVIKRKTNRYQGGGENKFTENEDIRGGEKEKKDVERERGNKMAQKSGLPSSSSIEEYRMAVNEAYGFLDSIGDTIDEDEEGKGMEENRSERVREDVGSEKEDTSKSYGSESEGGRHTSDAEDSLERTFKTGMDAQDSSLPHDNKATLVSSSPSNMQTDSHTTATPKDESTKSTANIAERKMGIKEKGNEHVSPKLREGKKKSEQKSSDASSESGIVSTTGSLEEELDEETLAKMSVASRKVYWDRRLKKVEEKNKEPAVVTTVARRPMKISGIVARGRMSFERSGMRDESITSDSGGSGGKSSSESSPSSEEKSRKLRKSPIQSKSKRYPPPTSVDREKKLEEAAKVRGIDSERAKDLKIVEAVDSVGGETNREDNCEKNSMETKKDGGDAVEPILTSKEAQETAAEPQSSVSRRREMWNEKIQKNSEDESQQLSIEHRSVGMEKSTGVESTKKLPGKLSTEEKIQNKSSKAMVYDHNQDVKESTKLKEFISSEAKQESMKEVKKAGPVKSTGSVSRLAKLFSAPPEPPPPTIIRKVRPATKFKTDKTDNNQGLDKATLKSKEETYQGMNFKKKEATPVSAQENSYNISSAATAKEPSVKNQSEGSKISKESSRAANENKESGVVGRKFGAASERTPSLHDTGKSNSLPIEGITAGVEGRVDARKQMYLESTKQRSSEGDVTSQVGIVKMSQSEEVIGKAGMRKVRNMWERRASLDYTNGVEKTKKPLDESNKKTGFLAEKKKSPQGKISSKKIKVSPESKDEAKDPKAKPSRVEQTEEEVTTIISPKISQKKSISQPPKEIKASSIKPSAENDTKIKSSEDESKQAPPLVKPVSAGEEHLAERLASPQDKGAEEMGGGKALGDKKGIPTEKVGTEKSSEKGVTKEERGTQEIPTSMQNATKGKKRETGSRGQDIHSNWEMRFPEDKNLNLDKTLDSKPTNKQSPLDGKGSLEKEGVSKKMESREKKSAAKINSSPEKEVTERGGPAEKNSAVEIKIQPARTTTSVSLPRKKRLTKMESWDSWEEDAMDSISQRGKRDSLEIRVTDDEDNCVMREITSVPRFFPKDKMETHEEEASQCGSEMEESPCPSPCLEREEEEEKLLPLPTSNLTPNRRKGMPARTISVQISGIVASGRRRFEGGPSVPEEKPTPMNDVSTKTVASLEKKNSPAQYSRSEGLQKQKQAKPEDGERLNYDKAERDDGAVVASIIVGNASSSSSRECETKKTSNESEEMVKGMPTRVITGGDHSRPDICVVVGPEEAKTSALEGDEGGDDGRSAISRRAAKGKAPAQKKPPPSAASSPDSESDGVPGAKLGGFLSTPAAHIRRHSAVDVETLRAFSAEASEGGQKGSEGPFQTRRRGSGDLGSPAKRKENESKKRFTRARQFFECLEKGKDSPPSGAEDSVPEKAPPAGMKKKTRGKSSAENGLKTASVGRRTAVKHRPPLRGIHDSSESTTESDKEKHYKRKGRKCSTDKTHSAPGSEVDSSEGTPQKHAAHRRKREKDIVLRSQKFGGSERQVRVSERFNVMDLFKDVAGPLSGGGSGRATPLGIPHQAAVLAALRSVEDVRSLEAASPYDIYRPMEAANDCEPSKGTDENANAEAPTAEDEENVSFQSPMTLCVKREYHSEYPHLPMTSPRHSRHRSSNADLIPRNVLLQLDNNNQETPMTPKRRSIAELF